MLTYADVCVLADLSYCIYKGRRLPKRKLLASVRAQVLLALLGKQLAQGGPRCRSRGSTSFTTSFTKRKLLTSVGACSGRLWRTRRYS